MTVRRRGGGTQVGDVCSGFPYPYGTDLHWLWGWGQRIEDMLERENFSPGSHDWIVIRACRDAADAMMRFSIDYSSLVDEIRRCQRDVENRWDEVLDNASDVNQAAYGDSLDVLSRRIFKACELIAEREKATGQPDSKPDNEKKDSIALPENDHVTRLAKALRDNEDPRATKIGIAREFAKETGEDPESLVRQLNRFPHLLAGTRWEKKPDS